MIFFDPIIFSLVIVFLFLQRERYAFDKKIKILLLSTQMSIALFAVIYCLYSSTSLPILFFPFLIFIVIFFKSRWRELVGLLLILSYPLIKYANLKFGFEFYAYFPFLAGLYARPYHFDLKKYFLHRMKNLFFLVLVPLRASHRPWGERLLWGLFLVSAGLFVKACCVDLFSDFSNWFILSYFNLALVDLFLGGLALVLEFFSQFISLSLMIGGVLALMGFVNFPVSRVNLFSLDVSSFFQQLFYPLSLVYNKVKRRYGVRLALILACLLLDFSVKGLILGLIYSTLLFLYERLPNNKFIPAVKAVLSLVFIFTFVFLIRIQSFHELKLMWTSFFDYPSKFAFPRSYANFYFAIFNFFIVQLFMSNKMKIVLYFKASKVFKLAISAACIIMVLFTLVMHKTGGVRFDLIPF